MNCQLTYTKGAVQQTNYNHHEAMRIYQCPVIEIRALENDPKVRASANLPSLRPRPRSPMRYSRRQASASAKCRSTSSLISCEAEP